ncbi:hypothetical protein ACROYT_G018480 [Oculina patagonica]
MWSESFLLDQSEQTMANLKVAVFIALIVVLSQTAYSNSAPDCENDCHNEATFCTQTCSSQTCANKCTNNLMDCYDACGLKAKKEFKRPLAREPYQRDESDEEGFFGGFQK